jgi:putative tricarboxylic transport membrane protein
MLISAVGVDSLTGMPRLVFSQAWLLSGFSMVSIIIGLFGVSEVVASFDEGVDTVASESIGSMMPKREEWRPALIACTRGSIFGFVTGLIPGMIPAVTSLMAYDLEKRMSSHPERFGTGVIEGVAAPEAANNGTAQAGFIPMLALGIPTTATLAILMAALYTYGIVPGPLMFTQHASLTWTLIASMYIGNFVLLVLNLPLVGLWSRISVIPYRLLGPIVLSLCIIGTYVMRNSMLDVWIMLLFGAIGYQMRKSHWPTAPLALGCILGPMLEESLRQSVSVTGGSPLAFIKYPIFMVFLVMAGASIWLSYAAIGRLKKVVKEDSLNA